MLIELVIGDEKMYRESYRSPCDIVCFGTTNIAVQHSIALVILILIGWSVRDDERFCELQLIQSVLSVSSKWVDGDCLIFG